MNYLDLVKRITEFLTCSLAVIYIVSIWLIRRTQGQTYIFTINLAIAIILFSSSELLNIFKNLIDKAKLNPYFCSFYNYHQFFVAIHVPFSLIAVSFYRFLTIVYHSTVFFRTKRFVTLCIAGQWFLGVVFSVPSIFVDPQVIHFFRSCHYQMLRIFRSVILIYGN
jgi:hypothetical protein